MTGGAEGAGEVVFEADTAGTSGEEIGRKLSDALGEAEAEEAGGGERISLDMVDEERVAGELVAAAEVLVGAVALAVETPEIVAEPVLRGQAGHAADILNLEE
jgi:hypothetical protein